MAKNIVICCDGTGNGFDNPETDSNVVKLYNTLHIGPEKHNDARSSLPVFGAGEKR